MPWPRPQTPAGPPADPPRDSQFLSRAAESTRVGSDGADRDLVCVTVRHHYGPRAGAGPLDSADLGPDGGADTAGLTTAARQYLSAINVSCRAVVARSFDKDRQRRRRRPAGITYIYTVTIGRVSYTVESRGASRALSSIIDGGGGRYTPRRRRSVTIAERRRRRVVSRQPTDTAMLRGPAVQR